MATSDTRPDEPGDHGMLSQHSTRALWTQFALIAMVVVVGGWAIAQAAEIIVDATGLNAGFVGGIFMGLVNALPETVTAVAAVRRGALTLAIAAIIGGNQSLWPVGNGEHRSPFNIQLTMQWREPAAWTTRPPSVVVGCGASPKVGSWSAAGSRLGRRRERGNGTDCR